MADVVLAPGEVRANGVKLSPSLVLFWLKTDIAVTNTRIAWSQPNTLFKAIPLGYDENSVPLSNVASVGANVKFSVGTAVWGLFLLIISFILISVDSGGAKFFGVILLLLSLVSLLNSLSASLVVRNNGGASSAVTVSILEKSKVERFKEQVSAQLYADHMGMRHQENMTIQRDQLGAQQAQAMHQQQLNQHFMQQGQPQQQPHPQQAQPQQQPHSQQQWQPYPQSPGAAGPAQTWSNQSGSSASDVPPPPSAPPSQSGQ